ncbi:MAG: hypothetical protein J6S87_02365 [Bacteroidales bacterium]|nr:hypothetical protein [Bacteroidales bacterium]
MKKSISIFGLALLLGAFLLGSCSFDKKGTATIYDGETQWENWTYTFATGETPEGDLALWQINFATEIGNSYRTLSLTMYTAEPGTYSGVFDENSGKWSDSAIYWIRLTLDYDGQPYPEWEGKSATVTIHNYDKKTKAMTATLEAVVVKKGTNETRNIKVEMDNLHLVGK